MVILGIETSCDETAASLVKDGRIVLTNVVASSADLHRKTGGIVPETAARRQVETIIPVIDQALARRTIERIDKIAVTVGPGLIGSLLVGVETAKALSFLSNKPLVAVNHLVGHIYASFLAETMPEFPAVSLVVSGGHTDLVLINGHRRIDWLGGTRDDAAGEAFDKTARLLSLPYPGGPAIAKEAGKYLSKNPQAKLNLFPRPMINDKNFDWSFSGLKTAVMKAVKNNRLTYEDKQEIAAEIQEAIVDSLVKKSLRAVEKYRPKSFILAGGVAANSRLRKKFADEKIAKKLEGILHVCPVSFCTDNAAMIAAAAFYVGEERSWRKIEANPALTIVGEED